MQRGTEVCTCTLTFAQGSRSICSAVANREPRRKSSLVSQSLQDRFGKAANRRSRSVKHLSTPSLQNARQKEQDMTAYPVEFHRRLEQKWQVASTRFSPQARQHRREIPTTTMMMRTKTKRTKTGPTNRRSCANRMWISVALGHRCGDPVVVPLSDARSFGPV